MQKIVVVSDSVRIIARLIASRPDTTDNSVPKTQVHRRCCRVLKTAPIKKAKEAINTIHGMKG